MASRKPRRTSSLQRTAFFVPVVVVLLIAAVAILSGSASSTGVLVVTAQSSSGEPLHVTAKVGSSSGQTPFNLSLDQGSYNVVYPSLEWYSAPSTRTVTVVKGLTQYSVGVYRPVERVVIIAGDGFNATQVTAMHGLTPVVWVNDQTSIAFLSLQGKGIVSISPAQNYTYIFPNRGTFEYSLYNTNSTGTVQVA